MLSKSLGFASLVLLVVYSCLIQSSMLCHAAARPARGTGQATAAMDGARHHTSQPIVTGTSVLGIKYK